MPNINLAILNQKSTPAFFGDTFANRPAASFVGRIFISTDTFDLYRDTGTAWVLLSPSSSGTIGGSGTTNTIPLFTGSTSIGDSIITQQTGAQSITIGSFATPFNVIGYGLYYGSGFVKSGATANDILAGNGALITAGTNITISAGQISATSSGGVTGTGSAGQVSFWSGASSISGSNNLFWDNVSGHLGIGNITPGTALDIHDNQSTLLQLNSTFLTNDCRIAFQSNGITNWRIGNFYNVGANDFAFYDVLNSQERFSIKTTGQTFVGAQTTSSGLLVVNNSAVSDQHLVILGQNAPSIRVRDFGTAATKQFGLGLATTINNFIQGTTGGEMCIFNDSTTAQPILFGIANVGITNEVARFSSAKNLLIGGTTDNLLILQTFGDGAAGSVSFTQYGGGSGANIFLRSARGTQLLPTQTLQGDLLGSIGVRGYDGTAFSTGGRGGLYMYADENYTSTGQATFLLLMTTPIGSATRVERMRIKSSGVINISNIPTSSAGLVTGDIYSNAGILTIV